MRRADHLQCRRGRWSVRLRVPAHLVATVGQTHLVRSLDTSSEAVARERRWVALALLWEWIGAQTVSDGWKPVWATELTGAGRSVSETAQKSLNRISYSVPPLQPRRVGQRARPSRTSVPQTRVLPMMERWLAEIEGIQTNQSRMQHAQAVREFSETQPPSCTVDEIDRRVAGEFVSGQYRSK